MPSSQHSISRGNLHNCIRNSITSHYYPLSILLIPNSEVAHFSAGIKFVIFKRHRIKWFAFRSDLCAPCNSTFSICFGKNINVQGEFNTFNHNICHIVVVSVKLCYAKPFVFKLTGTLCVSKNYKQIIMSIIPFPFWVGT